MLYPLLRDIAFIMSRAPVLRTAATVIRLGAVVVGTVQLANQYGVVGKVKNKLRRNKNVQTEEYDATCYQEDQTS